MTPPRFDLLAPHYRWMEAVSFGRLLHRCRVALLGRMTDARRALVLGDGDGRFLRDLLAVNPRVTVDAIDGSRAMTAEAERRAEMVPGGRPRVRFRTADARTVSLPAAEYDLVVTHFFLDCFPHSQLGSLVERVAAACAPGGRWMAADFRLPARGAARAAGGVALFGLYAFFRLVTGLPAGRLVDPDPLIRRCGFAPEAETRLLGGFLSCRSWVKTGGAVP